jgi:hypothetical protein
MEWEKLDMGDTISFSVCSSVSIYSAGIPVVRLPVVSTCESTDYSASSSWASTVTDYDNQSQASL